MGRKNQRQPEPEPIDVTASEFSRETRLRLETSAERDARLNAEWRKRRERNDRRADERVARAVNWDECCIPGCGHKFGQLPQPLNGRGLGTQPPPRRVRNVAEELPICPRHLVIIGKQGSLRWDDPDIEEARKSHAKQLVTVQAKRERKWDLAEENNGAEGQLYFVRLNGLVKVGWSSRLRSRLKSYGADVEILCHFPGTRTDETNLHRQLRPYLAKGREWYQDCDLIHDVVAGYIKQYGQPSISPTWTQPKPPTIKPRRAS